VEAPQDLRPRHFGQRAKQRAKKAIHDFGVLLGKELAHEGIGFVVGASEQAHEGASALLGVGGKLERVAEEGLDDAAGLERLACGVGLEAIERSQAALIQGGQATAEDRLHQRILAAEVVIDRSEVGVGRAGDHPHRGPVEAMLHEQALGRIEDAITGVGVRCRRSGCHRDRYLSNVCLNHTFFLWPVKRNRCRAV